MRTTAVLLGAEEEEIPPEKNLVTANLEQHMFLDKDIHCIRGSPWKSMLCPVILITSQKRTGHTVQYFKYNKNLKSTC